MKLQDIRDAKSFEELKPGIKLLCDKMHEMTYGEFLAYKRTLETQCQKVGSSIKELNDYAVQYQIFGYEE